MTTVEFMNDVRIVGGRCWQRRPDQSWQRRSYWDIKKEMRLECGVTSAEARIVLEAAKRNSCIDDPLLQQEIEWFRFTRGENVRIIGGNAVFVNKAGCETRRMTLENYRQKCAGRLVAGRSPCPVEPVAGGHNEED